VLYIDKLNYYNFMYIYHDLLSFISLSISLSLPNVQAIIRSVAHIYKIQHSWFIKLQYSRNLWTLFFF